MRVPSFALVVLLCACTPVPGGSASPDPYAVFLTPDGIPVVRDEARRLEVRFGSDGATGGPVGGDAYRFTFGTPRMGRETLTSMQPTQPVTSGRDVRYTASSLVTWFHHDEIGLQQGFEVPARPAGLSPLRLEVPLELTNLEARPTRDGIRFTTNDGVTRLTFTALSVWDALGTEVSASLSLGCDGGCIAYEIDDNAAVYPLSVDPLLISQELHAVGPAGSTIGQHVATAGERAATYDAAAHLIQIYDRAGGAFVPSATFPIGVPGAVQDLAMSHDPSSDSYFLVAGISDAPQIYTSGAAGDWTRIPFTPLGAMAAGFGTVVAADERTLTMGDASSGRFDVVVMPAPVVGLPVASTTNYDPAAGLPDVLPPLTAMDLDASAAFLYTTGPSGMSSYALASAFDQAPTLGSPVAGYTTRVSAAAGLVVAERDVGVLGSLGSDVFGAGAGITVAPLFTAPGTGPALSRAGSDPPRLYTQIVGTETIQVYQDPTVGGTGFVPDQVLAPVVPIPGNGFGSPLDSWGETLVVGVPGEGATGAVYLFTVSSDTPPSIVRSAFETPEGGTLPLGDADLRCIDAQDGAAELTWSFDTLPEGGVLLRAGLPIPQAATFTQAEVTAGQVAWADGGAEPGVPRALLLTCTDTDGQSASVTVAITVAGVGDPPVVDLNSLVSAWIEDAGPVLVPDPAAFASDPDSRIGSLQVTNIGGDPLDVLDFDTTGTPLLWQPGTGHLVGLANAAVYTDVLRTLTFDHSSHDPGNVDRILEVQVTDETGLDSPVFTHTILVTPVNDAPVIDVNTGRTQRVFETVVLTTAELSAVDPDNTPDEVVFTLTVLPLQTDVINGGVVLPAGGTFTLRDLLLGQVAIQTFNPIAPSVTFNMFVSDPTDIGLPNPSLFVVDIETVDVDEDGFVDEAIGGDDCDDTNPDVNPGVPEDEATPFDDNCDGLFATNGIFDLVGGDLVVTEILSDPTVGLQGTWFELTIFNSDYDLGNCVDLHELALGNNFGVELVTTHPIACFNTPLVFAADPTVGALPFVDYDYADDFDLDSGFYIGTTLGLPGFVTVLDWALLDPTFPDPSGASIQVSPAIHFVGAPNLFNDDGANWCPSLIPWAAGDYGSPGVRNPPCDDQDEDGFLASEDDCDDGDDGINPGQPEIEGNSVDENCDGLLANNSIDDLDFGDLVITEIHFDPGAVPDAWGEWFELTLIADGFDTGNCVDLVGLGLGNPDGVLWLNDDHPIACSDGPPLVYARLRVVVGDLPAIDVDYDDNFNLPNGPFGELAIYRAVVAGGFIVPQRLDTVAYGSAPFPNPTGASI